MATVGGVVSVPLPVPSVPLPLTIRRMLSASAATLTFTVAVADVVGVKRTVTAWLAPGPRLNGLPERTLKGAEVDIVPETVPEPVFDTVKTRSAEFPILTVPKSTAVVGVTA